MQLGIIDDRLTEESFRQNKEQGFHFIETCQNIGRDTEEFAAKVPALLAYQKQYGIGIGALGRWGTDKFASDGSIIEEELANNLRLIDCAAQLGCPVFNCGINYVQGKSLYENAGMTIDYLTRLLHHGREQGVKIATYNCHWNSWLTGPQQWELIHGHLPQLGIKYDPTHCINDGSGLYLEETERWGNRFYHVHIKGTLNFAGEHYDDPPAGLDQINWRAFLGLLYYHKYTAGLSIEPHSSTWQGELGDWGVRFSQRYIAGMLYPNE